MGERPHRDASSGQPLPGSNRSLSTADRQGSTTIPPLGSHHVSMRMVGAFFGPVIPPPAIAKLDGVTFCRHWRSRMYSWHSIVQLWCSREAGSGPARVMPQNCPAPELDAALGIEEIEKAWGGEVITQQPLLCWPTMAKAAAASTAYLRSPASPQRTRPRPKIQRRRGSSRAQGSLRPPAQLVWRQAVTADLPFQGIYQCELNNL
jgi:hypothetical protein